MDVFFQLIAGFSLFFGIAGLVYSTEVSKRCQALIDNRFEAVETQLARKIHRQDKAIAEAVHAMRQIMAKADEMAQAQNREINALITVMTITPTHGSISACPMNPDRKPSII